ncbi:MULTISPECIES: DUF3696 domain-containing protein [unclassified Streptomyces]|uniref:AAA family ATPase n=1 Tax=unclassified Streptomyces TaxID=2593676 RepID=UPI000DDB5670|nr:MULTISPECIES: DUF3696 domain-containing protein [unclassified Streptomyces]QZZ29089.1 DUF3696 domain-containing protein [Streptomyces sp. ST1015]
MISALSIERFKCFASKTFEISPLTILTGVNGSGKSSLIQALLLARIAATQNVGSLQLNGPMGLALGEARDVLHWDHDEEDTIEILLHDSDAGDSWQYVFGFPRTERALHLDVLEIPSSAAPGISASRPGFTYLCAERLGPRDLLAVSADEPGNIGVGVQGEYTAQVLALRETRSVSQRRTVRPALHHPQSNASQPRLQAEAWASDIIRPLQITAQLAGGVMASTIRFAETRSTGEEVLRPANTGFGVSYALPIIVAGLLTEPGDLLIVENPEAHLHPAGQSKLGRFLARVAGSGVQVVVETHSDHVLNGARLAVAVDGSIRASDMITHYFDHDGSTVIGINDKGELDHWPGGFFDQIETDLGQLARARRGR